jgi:hypothetical protein
MHFLRKGELECPLALGKPRAAVQVRVAGTQVAIMEDSLVVAHRDALFVPLPERIKVVGPDGKVVTPSRDSRFWVTVETIDPYHLVIEAKALPL